MKKDYNNTNRGALFYNDRKTTDNHPDRTGTINIDGVEYWLSAWDKEGQKGPYISLSVKRKEPHHQSAGKASGGSGEPREAPDPQADDPDDDIPF